MKRLLTIIILGLCSCTDFNPEKHKALLEDYAKYLNALDECLSYNDSFPDQNGEHLIPRYKYDNLGKDISIHPFYYGSITYRAKLDSMLNYATSQQDAEQIFMLRSIARSYDDQHIEWNDFQKIAKGIYEITDLNTQSVYIIERYRAKKREKPIDTLSLSEWNEDAESLKEKTKGVWKYYVYYRWGYHIIFSRKETIRQDDKD
jgi:lipoprotein